MFHFDAKFETYSSFFSHPSSITVVDGLHTALMDEGQLVVGSDDEKALVHAIPDVFRSRLLFTTHLRERAAPSG